MASKWPEAVHLKTVTARAVIDTLVEVLSRNGIPLTILSD